MDFVLLRGGDAYAVLVLFVAARDEYHSDLAGYKAVLEYPYILTVYYLYKA